MVSLSDTDREEIDRDVRQEQSQKKAPLQTDLQKRREAGVDFSGPRLQKGKLFSCLTRVISFHILTFDFRETRHRIMDLTMRS